MRNCAKQRNGLRFPATGKLRTPLVSTDESGTKIAYATVRSCVCSLGVTMVTMTPPMTGASKAEIRNLIDREAQLLGISGDEAIERVQRGNTGESYLWRDLSSLVFLLNG